MRLLGSDETFRHQVALPHTLVGSSDPSWRERYWISFHDVQNKDLVFSCGFGQYPNQNVQEAFVVVSDGHRQRNLRLARALSSDPERLKIGPFSIDVVRPFEELHLVLEENPSGISFDVRWLGHLEPILEEPHFEVTGTRVTHDAIRYVQHGRAQGSLTTSAGRREIDPATWWTERDHSWGTRPLPRSAGAPPGARPHWRFLAFCPVQFEDLGFHLYLYEGADGRTQHLSARLTKPLGSEGPDLPPVVGVNHDLEWETGGRTVLLRGGTIELELGDGTSMKFEVKASGARAHLRGGGYEGWNGWLQGHWKGEDSLEHEEWDLDDPANAYRYAKAGNDHLIEVTGEGRTGYGIIEYMVLKGHERYAHALPERPEPSRA